MAIVNENVLDNQLEIVNKKMQEYEQDLFAKIDDKIKALDLDFTTNKKETMVNIVRNKFHRHILIACIMS